MALSWDRTHISISPFYLDYCEIRCTNFELHIALIWVAGKTGRPQVFVLTRKRSLFFHTSLKSLSSIFLCHLFLHIFATNTEFYGTFSFLGEHSKKKKKNGDVTYAFIFTLSLAYTLNWIGCFRVRQWKKKYMRSTCSFRQLSWNIFNDTIKMCWNVVLKGIFIWKRNAFLRLLMNNVDDIVLFKFMAVNVKISKNNPNVFFFLFTLDLFT